MSYSWHPIESLGPPFLMVDEATFLIPKGGVTHLMKSHFKFLFILDGSIEHEIESIDGTQILNPGDVLVAPAASSHTYINTNQRKAQPVHLVRLFLDSEYLSDHALRRVKKPENDFSDFILHHFQSVLQLTGGVDNEIASLLAQLRQEADLRAVGYRHRVRSICTNLIVSVARKQADAEQQDVANGGSSASSIVVGAKEYILKHLADDLKLGDIAWQVGKGEEHLARVFKRETGRSVFDYVREARINRAQTLILDPSLTFGEVAERCGFHSLSFFSRTFRQVTGMSPSGYRRHMEAVLS